MNIGEKIKQYYYLKKLRQIVQQKDLLPVEKKIWEGRLHWAKVNKRTGVFPYIGEKDIRKIKHKLKQG